MGKRFERISRSRQTQHDGQHRFEHWLVDNQVYFITARVRDKFHAFASEEAKAVFWDRFDHYTSLFLFTPWVTSLLDNHYHTIGYLKIGANLPKMMQRLHGSVAKLVNDTLPRRFPEFWRDAKGHEYFDGCLRDEKQGRLTYRYVLTQAKRHGIATDFRDYPHTRVSVELESAIAHAKEIRAFLNDVPYKRYGQR
ncbi:MAG: hypothetical protein WBD40_12245 [Tepidisphaeraceae bacterium]